MKDFNWNKIKGIWVDHKLIVSAVLIVVIGLLIFLFAEGLIDSLRSKWFWENRAETLQRAENSEKAAKKWQDQAIIYGKKANEFSHKYMAATKENTAIKEINKEQAALIRKSNDKSVKEAGEKLAKAAEKFEKKDTEIENTEDDQQLAELCKEDNSWDFCKNL